MTRIPGTRIRAGKRRSTAAGPQNSDAARGAELIAADTSIGTVQVQVLGHSAYGSGDLLAALRPPGTPR
ncbi:MULTISPECIES: hypothetical protein [unclassified Arthrobacter]|uniref:hypothetical protein n=1 Tax=unclassified Arthrobacter TaxID=235627 RepID=UPI003399A732